MSWITGVRAQRRREIGIRLALGAAPRAVVRMVIGNGLALAGAGLAAGTLLSLALARALSALVAEVDAPDPLVFAAVVPTLVLTVLLTCYLPARAASRVGPAETLSDG